MISPSGKLVPHTFDIDQDQCWVKAFDFLYYHKKWMKPYYKKWHESIAAAEKRGWEIVKVNLQAVV